jgi:hypothetical protein
MSLGAALVAAALIAGARGADDSGYDAKAPPKKSEGKWFPWWPRDDRPAEAKSAAALPKGEMPKEDKKSMEKEAASNPQAAPEAKAAAARRLEEAALLRRLAVCDQLKVVALQTKDEVLLEQADRLDEQARAVYSQRIARLPASQGRTRSADASGASAKSAKPVQGSAVDWADVPEARRARDRRVDREEDKP